VAFGKALGRREYEKRKVCGLTYWAGITLRKPPEVSIPRENKKSDHTLRAEARRERLTKQQAEEAAREKARIERQKEVKARMAGESKEKIQAVGLNDTAPTPEAD